MLHPKQFEVNDLWIAFRLNGAPIRTEHDGDFNCIAQMDAASCYIFGSELISVADAEPTPLKLRRLLKTAQRHKQQPPKTLFVPHGDLADLLTREAKRRGIDVVHVSGRSTQPLGGIGDVPLRFSMLSVGVVE